MTTSVTTPSGQILAPPAHGHGMISTNGSPGNKGGRGKPTSAIRRRCAKNFQQLVPELVAIARDVAQLNDKGVLVSGEYTADRLKAIDLLGKYGLGTIKEVSSDQVRERVSQTLDVIRACAPPELAAEIIAALRPVWA